MRKGALTWIARSGIIVATMMLASSLTEEPTYAQGTSPLAKGLDKWLGNVHSEPQIEEFEFYWNQVTPENAGKWGSVESVRDQMNWDGLDAAYLHAKTHGIPFRFHVLVWGSQQPGWIDALPADEQLEEIEEWFRAVAERYPEIDYLEVVNEPLHQPPSYKFALAGPRGRGWDWVVNAFQMARDIFPAETRLVINDYGILSDLNAASQYKRLIDLLQQADLIDGICVQGHAFNTRDNTFVGTEALDLLSGTGLPIQISEMDVDGNPTMDDRVSPGLSDQNQLADMQRIFPVLWEHEAVIGITMWGWRPGLWRQAQEANLLRADGSERPALQWLREYLEEYRATGIASEPGSGVPAGTQLVGNYPNPFRGSTTIRYTLDAPSHVNLTVYDLVGREIATLVEGQKAPGPYEARFDALNFAPGAYVYRLSTDSFAETRPMVLIR